MSYTPGLWLEPQLATDEQNRWIDRNAGRDGQSICRSLNNSCAQKSLAYPSLQSHLHEASTLGSSSRPTWRPQPAPACMSANSSRRRGCRLDRPRRPAIPPSRRRSPPATGPAAAHREALDADFATLNEARARGRNPKRRTCSGRAGSAAHRTVRAADRRRFRFCPPNRRHCRAARCASGAGGQRGGRAGGAAVRDHPGGCPQRGAKSGWRCVPWRK